MIQKGIFIRNIEADDLFETFLIASVSSVLVIRFSLFITGYPQLGGEGLHIAHMLWGGFFMLIAIIMLLSFLSRTVMRLAAMIGGIGFGAFIDELGKFITSDNNYFFQPTVALIYIIFIIVYLIFQAIPKYRAFSEKEYLVNALDMTKEAVINDLDLEEERIAREYLAQANQNDPIVQSLTRLLEKIDAIEVRNPGPLSRLRTKLRAIYLDIVQSQFIAQLITFTLLLQSLVAIGSIFFVFSIRPELSFDQWGILISSVVSSFFVFRGLHFLRRNRLKAYGEFKLAVLISLLLTQFFVFYQAQFSALIAFFFNITVLLVVEYVLIMEKEKIREKTPIATAL